MNMKKYIKLYLMLLVLPFMVTSCLDKDVFNVNPNLATVSNLQYTLNGDSVKLTWTLPAGKDSIGVVVIPNATGAPIALKMNATSYTYGIVEVNKPLMFTVKISDTKGNISLGQTVKFTRAGASPIKSAVVTQVDNNVVFSWAAPDSAVTGIVLKYLIFIILKVSGYLIKCYSIIYLMQALSEAGSLKKIYNYFLTADIENLPA